jgi:hypothetical protein
MLNSETIVFPSHFQDNFTLVQFIFNPKCVSFHFLIPMTTDEDSQVAMLPLALVTHNYVLEACPNITPSDSKEMDRVINACLSGEIDHMTATHISVRLIGTSCPIDKLRAILSAADRPLSSIARPQMLTLNARLLKKNELWSESNEHRGRLKKTKNYRNASMHLGGSHGLGLPSISVIGVTSNAGIDSISFVKRIS